MTRLLAACGWLAWGLRRLLGNRPRFLGSSALRVGVVIGLLIGLSPLPIVLSFRGDQPEEATVADVVGGEVERADRWIRMRGEVRGLGLGDLEIPDAERYALLLDAEDPTLGIVVRGERPPRGPATVTGRLAPFAVRLPGFAAADAPGGAGERRLVTNLILELDPEPHPERRVPWMLSLLPLGLAGLLWLGLSLGYPIFREAREIDILARPLGSGERLPSALAGELHGRRFALHDPVEAVLAVSPGRRGGVLAIELPGDRTGGRGPIPVGDGWTTGQAGWVHTVRESVPALAVRAEDVDAILMFASVGDRDRAAALVGTR